MNKKFVLLGMLLVVLGIMGIGCYTVLTHPRVEGEEGEVVEHTGRYYREHCTDCHIDYHRYPYGFYYGYYPDYYWSYPRWGRYYAYPWWWDRYWWDDDYYYYDDGESVPESAEKAERRRGMEPPYVLPEGTTGIPFNPPAPVKGKEGPEIKDKPTPKPIDKGQEQKKEEKPEETKAKRRRTD
jgi:hypothetical protein